MGQWLLLDNVAAGEWLEILWRVVSENSGQLVAGHRASLFPHAMAMKYYGEKYRPGLYRTMSSIEERWKENARWRSDKKEKWAFFSTLLDEVLKNEDRREVVARVYDAQQYMARNWQKPSYSSTPLTERRNNSTDSENS